MGHRHHRLRAGTDRHRHRVQASTRCRLALSLTILRTFAKPTGSPISYLIRLSAHPVKFSWREHSGGGTAASTAARRVTDYGEQDGSAASCARGGRDGLLSGVTGFRPNAGVATASRLTKEYRPGFPSSKVCWSVPALIRPGVSVRRTRIGRLTRLSPARGRGDTSHRPMHRGVTRRQGLPGCGLCRGQTAWSGRQPGLPGSP